MKPKPGAEPEKCETCGRVGNIATDPEGKSMGMCWHCVTGDGEFARAMEEDSK